MKEKVIYDNGGKILGEVRYIIQYLEDNKDNLSSEEIEDLGLDNLIDELDTDYNKTDIIVLNYDNPMGNTIDCVFSQDTDQLEYYKEI